MPDMCLCLSFSCIVYTYDPWCSSVGPTKMVFRIHVNMCKQYFVAADKIHVESTQLRLNRFGRFIRSEGTGKIAGMDIARLDIDGPNRGVDIAGLNIEVLHINKIAGLKIVGLDIG